MAKQKAKRQRDIAAPSPFEEARDELFQQIMQCGVIGAAPAHQEEWFRETFAYLADRYHELSPTQITELPDPRRAVRATTEVGACAFAVGKRFGSITQRFATAYIWGVVSAPAGYLRTA